MRSKLTILLVALVVAAVAPLALAATPAPSPNSAVEQALGLSSSTDRAAAPSPDENCWIEYRWVSDGCSGCYLKMRMKEQDRLCCQYTGCRAWQDTGKWTCNYACL